MRVVLDTNVLIAAALKGGLSEQILRIASVGNLTLITSEGILTELSAKLSSKFSWTDKESALYIETLREISEVATPSQKLSVISRDPDDNKILETAVEGKAELVVSMDQDLLQIKSYQSVSIVHPKTLTWILPKLFEEK